MNSDIDEQDQPQAIIHDSGQTVNTRGHFAYFDQSEEQSTQRDLNTTNHTRTGENRYTFQVLLYVIFFLNLNLGSAGQKRHKNDLDEINDKRRKTDKLECDTSSTLVISQSLPLSNDGTLYHCNNAGESHTRVDVVQGRIDFNLNIRKITSLLICQTKFNEKCVK